jgi:hypothetical protein
MLRPVRAENPMGIESPELLFLKPFRGEFDVRSAAALAIVRSFQAASDMELAVTRQIAYKTTHEPDSVQPSLGIFDQRFSLRSAEDQTLIGDANIAPMGVNGQGTLLGCFDVAKLGGEDSVGPTGLFEDEPLEDYHNIAYATIFTPTIRVEGVGLLAMKGRVTLFEGRPSDEQLVALTNGISPIGREKFPISRLDTAG